jgi:hypothetical protein
VLKAWLREAFLTVNGDAHVGADDGAQGTAGAFATRVVVAGRVVAFGVERLVGHDDDILRADGGAESASFAPPFVYDDVTFGHEGSPYQRNRINFVLV